MYLEFNRANKTMKIYNNEYRENDLVCTLNCDEYLWLNAYSIKMYYNDVEIGTVKYVYYIRMK